ncbi:hypothetical protein [Roseobacter sp. CCS2]|uniref:hypothetical protein n=1 Tax=Roseobacter sp. CCS2 TaxID=391593 RepID=UPI0000F3F14B|nr:hypothetical protein [Roseobacter sp. CCS2]EBA11164.1 hypothetical protein RCCS2_10345 [Roseobacter sp. CCS2]
MSDTSDLSRYATEHVKELGTQAKAAAKQEAVAQADQIKDTATSKMQAAADSADAAARELDPASPQAQAVQQVADRIEDAAVKLRDADIGELAGQVTDMARRNPLLFIGGAAVAGFAAARFLKAREPRTMTYAHSTDPWSSRLERMNQPDADGRVNGERNYG